MNEENTFIVSGRKPKNQKELNDLSFYEEDGFSPENCWIWTAPDGTQFVGWYEEGVFHTFIGNEIFERDFWGEIGLVFYEYWRDYVKE